ncbi:hypothetical protein WJX73_008211 [Symbiochloris irregularis]|uniref:Fungal lipase-type domain-containing protein n=1 Tax=Symbiochloris irregularis TaxID=706552 RepID=A0AAW1PBL0_9CHLO
MSLVNNTAPDFSIPAAYRACDFPFAVQADSEGYHPAACHFLALCMKLVYERPAVIQDIIENQWGVTWHQYLSTGLRGSDRLYLDAKDKAQFEPHTRTMVLETERAVVVAFRGSEPTNLINFRSSGRITLLPQSGMGRVHAGFWSCLFWGDAEGGTLYSRIVETLDALPDPDKPIYLTGHSLGAALALLFAQAANAQHPQLARRIAGVYGFAAPRVGDAAFAAACEAAYPQRIHHFVHASDIVPRVPPMILEYRHTGKERFITSLGRVLSDEAQIKRWHRIEGFGFLPLYLYKIGAGILTRGETLRTVYRVVLLVVLPGLADHWPSDYEAAIRRQIDRHESG